MEIILNILRGLLGIIFLITICWLLSTNRKAIDWKLVIGGLLLQLVFALLVLKVPFITTGFDYISKAFVKVISFTDIGTDFMLRSFVSGTVEYPLVNFIFRIIPTIIFFSALTSLLFYLGIIQKIVHAIAWLMSKAMKMSGAESLSAAANIFVGQTEAPLLIKPYIGNMTRSEVLCVMVGGMATIAGGVMAAYVGFLGGDDPAMRLFFAKHLLCASVMSAPAAVLTAKLLLPQTEDVNRTIEVPRAKIGSNIFEAIANGTFDGIKLATNVAAMLIVFIALIAMVNYFFERGIGSWSGLNDWVSSISDGRYSGFTLQFIFGYIGSPVAWLMGVSSEDMVAVGQLLGEKTVLNELYAYKTLGQMQEANVFTEQKSIVIATYILCGFANFSSIGIQIGGIGVLAPNQRTLLSQLGIRALIGGTVASLFTATLAGIIL